MARIPLYCIESVMRKIYEGIQQGLVAHTIALTISEKEAGKIVTGKDITSLWMHFQGKAAFKTEMRSRSLTDKPLADPLPIIREKLFSEAELRALCLHLARGKSWPEVLRTIGRIEVNQDRARSYIVRRFDSVADFIIKYRHESAKRA